jgi:hypothetical protein
MKRLLHRLVAKAVLLTTDGSDPGEETIMKDRVCAAAPTGPEQHH